MDLPPTHAQMVGGSDDTLPDNGVKVADDLLPVPGGCGQGDTENAVIHGKLEVGGEDFGLRVEPSYVNPQGLSSGIVVTPAEYLEYPSKATPPPASDLRPPAGDLRPPTEGGGADEEEDVDPLWYQRDSMVGILGDMKHADSAPLHDDLLPLPYETATKSAESLLTRPPDPTTSHPLPLSPDSLRMRPLPLSPEDDGVAWWAPPPSSNHLHPHNQGRPRPSTSRPSPKDPLPQSIPLTRTRSNEPPPPPPQSTQNPLYSAKRKVMEFTGVRGQSSRGFGSATTLPSSRGKGVVSGQPRRGSREGEWLAGSFSHLTE